MDASLNSHNDLWQSFLARVSMAVKVASRSVDDIQILPVTKGKSFQELLPWLSVSGFPKIWGENYFEELEGKIQAFQKMPDAPRWHFIGALQSRKIEELCSMAECLQTLSRPKELALIKKRWDAAGKAPRFFIQVNVSGEGQKNGISPDHLSELLEDTAKTGLLGQLDGLMCLPESLETANEKILRTQFQLLRKLRDRHLPSGKLSMGMSSDFEWAIAEGSDLIRVGTVLFGERIKRG